MQPNEQLIAILGSLREQQTRDVTFVLAGESVSKGNHKELARSLGVAAKFLSFAGITKHSFLPAAAVA
jgi:hypothetical protein